MAVAAAVLVVLSLPRMLSTPERPEQAPGFGLTGEVRDKGSEGAGTTAPRTGQSGFVMRVQRGNEFLPVAEGQALAAGDVVRFFYSTMQADYLYVFSVDETGRISSYYPEESGFSVPIVRGRNIPLPGGVALDEYRGQERFFALFTSEPLSLATVAAAVGVGMLVQGLRGGGLAGLGTIPIGCEQASLLIEKR